MNYLMRCFNSVAAIQNFPETRSFVSNKDSQLLFGEDFLVDEIINGWAHGHGVLDNYEGWVHLNDLHEPDAPATHAVITGLTHIYNAPSFREKPLSHLSFLSRVTALEGSNRGGFVAIDPQGSQWVSDNHLIALDDMHANPADIVETAMMFGHSPYGYGGRSITGLDCSAVIQLSLQRNGIFCPRDSGDQMNVVGVGVEPDTARRSDIVYFSGHVGMMIDDTNILNATVRHMKTIVEPLAELDRSYARDGHRGMLAVRRLG